MSRETAKAVTAINSTAEHFVDLPRSSGSAECLFILHLVWNVPASGVDGLDFWGIKAGGNRREWTLAAIPTSPSADYGRMVWDWAAVT